MAVRNWSFDRADWDALASFDQEVKWKAVPLEQGRKKNVPNTTGIYMLIVEPPKKAKAKLLEKLNLQTVVYVGQGRLQDRFAQHVKGERPGVKDAQQVFDRIRFHYTPVPRDKLDELEGLLYKALGPPSNRIHPPGVTIRATVAREGIPIRS